MRGNAGETLDTLPTAMIVTAKSVHRLESQTGLGGDAEELSGRTDQNRESVDG
jgi:hypothetical protein